MNFYKKVIRDQKTRLKILKLLRFVPDNLMIKIQYKIKTGHRLNLKNPRRYTEKIQWYKLYYRKQIMTICSDKFEVRKFVEKKECSHLLNNLYAVYDSPEEVSFNGLPNSFAMKMTVGSGMNYFVRDMKNENEEHLKAIIRGWFDADSSSYGREWSYYNIKPRIIFEELLPLNERNDLPDYKFFCFGGEPYCLYTMIDYSVNHQEGKLGFFDMDFKLLPYYRKDFSPITEQLETPINFDEMVKYARILSKGFPHVRVDFYNVEGRVVFGEMTFYNASGYTVFEPDEFDYIMGDVFKIPEISGGGAKFELIQAWVGDLYGGIAA